jgi:hypothetical protein
MARILESMDEADRTACEAALADHKFSILQIVGVLRAEGYRISRTSVSDHRADRCLCKVEAEQ